MVANTIIYWLLFELSSFNALLLRNRSLKFVRWSRLLLNFFQNARAQEYAWRAHKYPQI